MCPSTPTRRAIATCLIRIVCVLGLASSMAASALPEAPSPLHWERIDDAGPEDTPTVIVGDPNGALAVGGVRGVRRISVRGVPETLLRRGPVTDLAFLDDGVLLVATGQGLYRVAPGGSPERESLSLDGANPVVARLDAARGVAVAATEVGVILRDTTGHWQRVRVLPQGVASLVALRGVGRDLELWSVIEGELWIAELRPDATEPWRHAQQPLPVRRPDGASDIAFDLPGADVVLVFPDVFVTRDQNGLWRSLRPSLPPGAQARRIAHAFERLWLATDAGLLTAPTLEGPWRRAASPVGALPVIGLTGGSTLAVATHRGVSVASQRAPLPVTQSPRDSALRIGSLHRGALLRQGLHPDRLRDLRERVRMRGWLPELHVTLGYEEQRDRTRDYDQSFLSGETRSLYDAARDRGRDLDVALTLSWDLGDVVYHPEEVDVSREARSVIALRDDVLDEVTQLYFERERVLARLAVAPPVERHDLALRAAELAAGLAAWTGVSPDAQDEASRSRNRMEELP